VPDRLDVRKTYKLFIGGQFPRSESGRSYCVDGVWMAQASRKDVRDAVKAARGALGGWNEKTAYNRGQILYRVAEMLEGRSSQFVTEGAAPEEVAAAVDRWVWYAGWTDKLHALVGTVNPVAGPYFDFTLPEAVGVVGVAAPESPALLGLVSRLAPVLAGGNTAVVLASEAAPRAAVTLAEVLATSDVPGGVANILTGYQAELLPWLASHLDVDSLDLTGARDDLVSGLEEAAAEGVTRVVRAADPLAESPYEITAFMEMKTVWHPIGI
jgi:acyl-CoA reductase-like NAD-dependent aldehyde dehydrogenase